MCKRFGVYKKLVKSLIQHNENTNSKYIKHWKLINIVKVHTVE